MYETVTVALDEPLVGPDGPITSITLREPTFSEYLAAGDVRVMAFRGNKPAGIDLNEKAIQSYLSICLVPPTTVDLMQQARARTARDMRAAILSFFPTRRDERSLRNIADELVFGSHAFSAGEVQAMTLSELLYWHHRAVLWSRRSNAR